MSIPTLSPGDLRPPPRVTAAYVVTECFEDSRPQMLIQYDWQQWRAFDPYRIIYAHTAIDITTFHVTCEELKKIGRSLKNLVTASGYSAGLRDRLTPHRGF
jgi:hypothetical protein